ncbi:MAG: peptidoglycan-binding protein [Anaerolineales bacterium]|nr:peptidoglycan-binding protein [Anaerolineales bacterium]
MRAKQYIPLILLILLALACQTITGSGAPTPTSQAAVQGATQALAMGATHTVEEATRVFEAAETLIPDAVSSPSPAAPEASYTPVASETPIEQVTALDVEFSVQDPPLIDDRVAVIKETLAGLGYEICLGLDEFYSPFYSAQTAAAVRQFQAANDLETSGIVDGLTWERLFSPSAMPVPQSRALEFDLVEAFPGGAGATDMVAIGGQLWMMSEGFGYVEMFDPASPDLFMGIYALEPLLGEEGYIPVALATDGTLLWVAFQGNADGMVLAYDVANAVPVEGLLRPVMLEAIHFEAFFIRGISHDGKRLSIAVEDSHGASILSLNTEKLSELHATALPMENFPAAPAFVPETQSLWVPVEGVLGDHAILELNASGLTGNLLGVCGLQVAYDGTLLWVVKADRVVGVAPLSGEVRTQALFDAPMMIWAITVDEGRLWLLAADEVVYYVEID